MRPKRVYLLLVVLTLLAIPTSARAASPSDEIVAGGVFVLKDGQILDGNLFVLAGTAHIEAGARVAGDILILAGAVSIDGEISGSVTVVGGTLNLEKNAAIRGDLYVLGGETIIDEAAEVRGAVQPNPGSTSGSNAGPASRLLNQAWGWFWVFLLSALAVIGAMRWPDHMHRIALIQTTRPALAAGFGLVTLFVMLPLALILAVTIILLPAALLLLVALGIAFAAGWASFGLIVGENAARALNQTWAPGLEAGLGSFFLGALYFSLGFLPCLGWMMRLALVLLCMGAAGLTRFGRQAFLSEE